ncbi:MAG TPA: hypothetical protein DDZ80_24575 [Cyanobacteria bacterium UBA8803]|nr:hypothetical protein [Cyanobacteria bacterium UBA9273]HBL61485.1 hypothetical protein [Cyanobacteria bacterium UBA8803]
MDNYCAVYQNLFPEVRSFEYFPSVLAVHVTVEGKNVGLTKRHSSMTKRRTIAIQVCSVLVNSGNPWFQKLCLCTA